MGIKLEHVLTVTIIVTVILTTVVKLTNSNKDYTIFDKELEFTDTTFIEVDRDKMQSRSFTTKGIREKGVLTLQNLKYSTDSIELLIADMGKYYENTLYLEGNVILNEKDGYTYTTEHAQYNQKTKILNVTSAFVAHMDKNIIRGNSLKYNTVKKELNATMIDAVIYTTDK